MYFLLVGIENSNVVTSKSRNSTHTAFMSSLLVSAAVFSSNQSYGIERARRVFSAATETVC